MISINNNIVKKDNVKINYKNLYDYLYSRNFIYIPKLISYNDNSIELEYVEDIKTDNRLKIKDLIKIVALLHSKTSYLKEITDYKYNKIYNNLINNIEYLSNYYNDLFNKFIIIPNQKPSQLLLITNYSIINYSINYTKDKINTWYNNIKENKKERVCLIHNNLSLEHFIKNTKEYLISWDNYIYDSPILDLYKLYKNESTNISLNELLDIYQDIFKLTINELDLLYILISMPEKVELTDNEYNNCIKLRKLINYLNNTYDGINKATKV